MNEGMYIGGLLAARQVQDNLAYNQIVAAFIAQGMSSEQAVIAANNHWNATHGPSLLYTLLQFIGCVSACAIIAFLLWALLS